MSWWCGNRLSGAQHAPCPWAMEISLVPLENGSAMTPRGGGEAGASCVQTLRGECGCPPTAGLNNQSKETSPRGRATHEDVGQGGRPLPPMPQELPQPRRPSAEDEEGEGDPGLGTVEEDQAPQDSGSFHHPFQPFWPEGHRFCHTHKEDITYGMNTGDHEATL